VSAVTLLPEVLILVGLALSLVGSALSVQQRRWTGSGLVLIALAALITELWFGDSVGWLLPGGFRQDRFALAAKAALLVALTVTTLIGHADLRRTRGLAPVVFLAALAGLVMASASAVPGMFAAAVLMTAALLLANGGRGRAWVLPGVGLVGYGASLLLLARLAGGWGLGEQTPAVGANAGSLAAGSVLMLGLVGLGLVGAAVWTSATAHRPLLIGVLLIAAMRLAAALAAPNSAWSGALAALAALTLVGCGLRALAAPSARSLVGWLGAFQCAWLAGALATHDRFGFAAALLLAGVLLTAWVAADLVAPRTAAEMSNLWLHSPSLAVLLCLCVLSLAGLPPLAGFFGDFAVLAELFRSGLVWVGGAALLGWVLALMATVRFIAVTYFVADPEEVRSQTASWRPVPVLAMLVILGLSAFANPIHSLAVQGAAALGLR